MTRKTQLQFGRRKLQWKVTREILRIGFPGALGNGYESIKAILVNNLLQAFAGSVAISACAAVDSLMWLFWAIPYGMLAVSRMLISISVGEEDRQTLGDIMRVMFRRYVPLLFAVSAVIILNAEPFTRIFYHDPGEDVFRMTVLGFRILPLYMPLCLISMHFVCYGQASGRKWLVHGISLLDGVVCVAGFTALLIPRMGVGSVYTANVLNGIVCLLVITGSACLRTKKWPRNAEQLMAIPDGFGAEPDERIDISVRSMDEVLMVSEKVTAFCRKRGIDEDTALSAGLCLEEMAGNIVLHGFTKDRKRHSIDIRVVHRDSGVIMRIRDDCVPFDPNTRKELTDPGDFLRNVGIRLVFKAAREVEYQSILGLNVLTIRV